MGEGAGAIWGRCGSGSAAGVIARGGFCPAGCASPEGGAALKGAVRGHEESADGLGSLAEPGTEPQNEGRRWRGSRDAA